MKLDEEMVCRVRHPIVDGGLQYKLSAKMARIEAKEEVPEDECGESEDYAGAAFADGEQKQAEDRKQDERKFEEKVCKRPEGIADGECFGEKVFGDGVGLMLEPMHASENEKRTDKGGGAASDQDLAPGAE